MRTSRFFTLGVLAATAAFAGVVGAKKNDDPDAPARGRLTGIHKDAGGANTFSLVITSGGKNNSRETTVTADDATRVVIDGKPARLADLVEGEPVTVTPGTGKAQTVAALTRSAGRQGGAAAAPATAPSTRPAAG